MSQLRSILDEMAATSADDLSLGELDAEITELLDCQRRVEVLVADRVESLRRRGGETELAQPSTTAYLMCRGGMSAARARRVVSLAAAKASAPSTHSAWSDGRLSTDQARKLLSLAEAMPHEFSDAEERLVEIVEPLSVSQTDKALEYWRQSVDGPGELDLEAQRDRRGLSLSKTVGGMRRIDGWLTSLAGEALEAALSTHMPPPTAEDSRTPRQRRHDALEELANCHLTHENRVQVGGERPHIQVLTDLDGLQGIAGGLHETVDTGEVLDVETIRLISCDSSVSRILIGPESEIVDVGRKTRVWTSAQRRAIAARDRHCTWQGCERPASWTDIHHIEHWADGGETSIDNGVLLCRYHHTEVHIQEAGRRRVRRRTSG